MDEPLFSSSLAADPDMAERVAKFVSNVCEKRQQLVTAGDQGDVASLRKIAQQYQVSGREHGYAELSKAADALVAACERGALDGNVRDALESFLAVIDRLRAGLPVGA